MRKIIAGNWKMNLGPQEALHYFSEFKKLAPAELPRNTSCVVFPPAYDLGPEIQRAARDAHIELGAQNVHWEEKGAFTGELSPIILKLLKIEWTLIGHSERRQFFGETDQTASKRLRAAQKAQLNVVYCVGELLAERESGKTEEVLRRQVEAFLTAYETGSQVCAIAYEPVWAIGTGKTATEAQAEQAHRFIRQVVQEKLGAEKAHELPILYGGSVTAENAKTLLSQPNVNGVLVGGASLKPESFVKILSSV